MNSKYICSKCGKTGVKLWRPYASCHIELTCFNCTNGKVHVDTDQIGWNVPAIPYVDKNGVIISDVYCGDEQGIQWWYSLDGPPFMKFTQLDHDIKCDQENMKSINM